MLRMFSTPVFPFWIKRATTPATRGADMLVPDARIVPPPFCKVTMPTEEMPQVKVTVSESSPGAEIVIPIFVEKIDRKSTRLNSSHMSISYAVFCLKKKKQNITRNKPSDITDASTLTSIHNR